MKAFRYKTATPAERLQHRRELNAKHEPNAEPGSRVVLKYSIIPQ